MWKSLPWAYVPPDATRSRSLRRGLAALLRSASALLAGLSRRLAQSDRQGLRQPGPQVLEFYAEAGAPEGALYVDGQLLGHLPGVNRL